MDEGWWAVAAGLVGLIAFAGGSLLADLPRIDASDPEVVDRLSARRTRILAGSVLSVTGAALLLWPLSLVATSGSDAVWPSLALFSVASWVLGFGFLTVGALLTSAVAWRDPSTFDPPTLRLALDAAHLAVWSVSAPIGAIAVVATTVVGRQAGVFGVAVVVLAAAKLVTVLVEVVGTGRRAGWNAGGWAAGTSGYVTVAWFAAVLVGLR